MIGKCKWFSNQKGFGFITPSDGSKDVFVHQSNIDVKGFRSLTEGQEVEFEVDENGAKGPRAVNVKLIGAILKPVAENSAHTRKVKN